MTFAAITKYVPTKQHSGKLAIILVVVTALVKKSLIAFSCLFPLLLRAYAFDSPPSLSLKLTENLSWIPTIPKSKLVSPVHTNCSLPLFAFSHICNKIWFSFLSDQHVNTCGVWWLIYILSFVFSIDHLTSGIKKLLPCLRCICLVPVISVIVWSSIVSPIWYQFYSM